jgi:hypothetical protein
MVPSFEYLLCIPLSEKARRGGKMDERVENAKLTIESNAFADSP